MADKLPWLPRIAKLRGHPGAIQREQSLYSRRALFGGRRPRFGRFRCNRPTRGLAEAHSSAGAPSVAGDSQSVSWRITISTRHPRCHDDIHQSAPEALVSFFIPQLFDNQDFPRAAPAAYSFEAPQAGFSTRAHQDSFLLICEAFLHARPSRLRGAWLL